VKRIILRIFAVILAIASLLLIAYPFVSNYLMSLNQQSEIVAYEQKVNKITKEEKNEEYKKAMLYNQKFLTNVVITDPFDLDYQLPKDVEYESTLDFGNGVMGAVEIPAINVNLPIYHGTSHEVLQKGIGHMQNTSLPIGGESTHSVLTGHTGIPSAKLFTDLNRLEKGDMFYIHVLGEVRAYKIIKKYIINPNDTNSLKVYNGEDYVSLITCYPYGINSHRLLVRGHRIENTEEASLVYVTSDAMQIEPVLVAPLVAAPMLLILMLWVLIRPKRRR
jgi:sortase A